MRNKLNIRQLTQVRDQLQATLADPSTAYQRAKQAVQVLPYVLRIRLHWAMSLDEIESVQAMIRLLDRMIRFEADCEPKPLPKRRYKPRKAPKPRQNRYKPLKAALAITTPKIKRFRVSSYYFADDTGMYTSDGYMLVHYACQHEPGYFVAATGKPHESDWRADPSVLAEWRSLMPNSGAKPPVTADVVLTLDAQTLYDTLKFVTVADSIVTLHGDVVLQTGDSAIMFTANGTQAATTEYVLYPMTRRFQATFDGKRLLKVLKHLAGEVTIELYDHCLKLVCQDITVVLMYHKES